jgi:hypothetical protein
MFRSAHSRGTPCPEISQQDKAIQSGGIMAQGGAKAYVPHWKLLRWPLFISGLKVNEGWGGWGTGGNLQCTPPSHCCSRLMKTIRTLGVGQTPAHEDSAPFPQWAHESRCSQMVWFFFVTWSIRKRKLFCRSLCTEQPLCRRGWRMRTNRLLGFFFIHSKLEWKYLF